VLTELVKGKPLHSLQIDASVVEKALGGLPTIKKHAAVLAADAFQNFIKDYHTT
jgi:NifU-like protein involved in Fe-S cluster formation